jgi:excisionase family DNA binding protein
MLLTEPAVLTVKEAAAILKIGRRQVYESLLRGEIPGHRIGKSWRISTVAFNRWLNGEEPNGGMEGAAIADAGHISASTSGAVGKTPHSAAPRS